MLCCPDADNPQLKQQTELQEQDIELAQHTPHFAEGDNDEVRRLEIYHILCSYGQVGNHLLYMIRCKQ